MRISPLRLHNHLLFMPVCCCSSLLNLYQRLLLFCFQLFPLKSHTFKSIHTVVTNISKTRMTNAVAHCCHCQVCTTVNCPGPAWSGVKQTNCSQTPQTGLCIYVPLNFQVSVERFLFKCHSWSFKYWKSISVARPTHTETLLLSCVRITHCQTTEPTPRQ